MAMEAVLESLPSTRSCTFASPGRQVRCRNRAESTTPIRIAAGVDAALDGSVVVDESDRR